MAPLIENASKLTSMAAAGILFIAAPKPGLAETTAPAGLPPAGGPCANAQFRQFDFWVGRWSVVDTRTRESAGSSVIERLYGGCGIRENWSEPGLTGGSLSSYDPADKRWRQTWVDTSGSRRDFVGGWDGDRMVLISSHPSARIPGATALERMTFTANHDASVRQYSDASLDGGKTWTLRYDYTYLPIPTVAAPTTVATAGDRSKACSAPERRQFDLWVGRWDVASASKPDVKVAESLIENLYGGCAIRENWMPHAAGDAGGSLSTYDAVARRWRQTWVDSTGSRVEFLGGWDGGAMVLTGHWPQPGHPDQLTRMTYTAIAGGAVRQLGETSDDQGATWQAGFDFIYRPAESQSKTSEH